MRQCGNQGETFFFYSEKYGKISLMPIACWIKKQLGQAENIFETSYLRYIKESS